MYSPHALTNRLKSARVRTIGAALAAGIAGSALIAIPVFAQTGNLAPNAIDDGYAIVQNIPTALSVLGNDTDPEGDALTIQSVSAPTHGTALLAAGVLTYTPTTAYAGSDSFTYTIADGHGNVDTAIVNLVVAATVGVPVALDDTINVTMNTGTSVGVLANDTDPDGQVLTISAVSTPAHGTATIVAGTSVMYTPTTGYIGVDAFTYTVSDGFGSTDTASVTVNVSAAGDAPVVQNDTATVVANAATVISPLANDTDANGDVLTIASITTPVHGAAVISGGSTTITYTPTTGYTGGDVLSYTVTDGNGHNSTGVIAITVVTESTMLAVNDTATAKSGVALPIWVLSNDVASNSANALTVTAVTTPGHGVAEITHEGKKVTYTSVEGYVGTDTFVYTVTETNGATATAVVTVTVKAKSDHDGDDDEDNAAKEACKNGGWIDLGFRNQGLCIAAANHGFIVDGQVQFPMGNFPIGLFPHGLCGKDVMDDLRNRGENVKHEDKSGKSNDSAKADKDHKSGNSGFINVDKSKSDHDKSDDKGKSGIRESFRSFMDRNDNHDNRGGSKRGR